MHITCPSQFSLRPPSHCIHSNTEVKKTSKPGIFLVTMVRGENMENCASTLKSFFPKEA
jgi:hypothetical protein